MIKSISQLNIKSACFLILLSYLIIHSASAEEEVIFNTTLLNSNNNNIDISKFSRAGYIMPGTYTLTLIVNNQEFPEEIINVISSENNKVYPCITKSLLEKLGLKKDIEKKILWNRDNTCVLNNSENEYFSYRIDLSESKFIFTVPQLYLEYKSKNWQPSSSWDNGVTGLLFDYNLNSQVRKSGNQSSNQNFNANGTLGGNFNAWRIRADWQTQYDSDHNTKQFNWNRIYAYRAIPKLNSKLTLGEDYLRSDIFDSISYIGANLSSDDSMLPPNLRGYAPEITGVATTNALVSVKKNDRVIYQTRVSKGPFKLQDLDEAVTGELEVEIEEENGNKQNYSLNVASVPYLTRPGSLRYKVAIGKPSVENQKTVDPYFGFTELSYGINNGWSLYGGAIISDEYNSLAIGFGRDLNKFGALSADSTISLAKDSSLNKIESGTSHRLSYSKRFDSTNSQVTFAGYRFSERGYMSLGEFIKNNENLSNYGSTKEKLSLTFSQYMESIGMNAYLNYNYNTYWNEEANKGFNLSLSKVANIGRFENISFSLNAYNYKSSTSNDSGVFATLTLPLEAKSTISYSGSFNDQSTENSVTFSKIVNEKTNYQLNAGVSDKKMIAGGVINYLSDYYNSSTDLRYIEDDYTSLGLNLSGGLTMTKYGAAFHRNNIPGKTRVLVNTNGIEDIPIISQGTSIKSNISGTVVIPNMNEYYQNTISVDVNKIPDNAEVNKTVNQITLTEGAIGYSKFDVIEGEKIMAIIQLNGGNFPPFGAIVKNSKNQDIGIFTDDGLIYLSGVKQGNSFDIYWDEKKQCRFSIPKLDEKNISKTLISCITSY